MSNLRNTELRARDINKLAGYKASDLAWEEGCDDTSEWVMASVSDTMHRENLKKWLLSKNINQDAEVVIVTLVDAPILRLKWNELLDNLDSVFNRKSFKLFEVDFKWHLEYAEQEIARFGRYKDS